MQLGSKHYVINAQSNFIGILKNIIFRNLNQFTLKFELYSMRLDNTIIVQSLEEAAKKNPTNFDIFKKVDLHQVNSFFIEYYEIPQLLITIVNYINNIKQAIEKQDNNYNINTCFKINFFNKCDILLSYNLLQQLYIDIDSFYKNYFILDTIYNIVISTNKDNVTENNNTNINKNKLTQLTNLVTSNENNTNNIIQDNNINNNLNIRDNNINNSDNNKCDDIFSLSPHNIVNNFLLNLIFSYYQYINKKECYLETTGNEDKVLIIHCPNILPPIYQLNNSYFKNIIISNILNKQNNIKTYFIKLINLITTNEFEDNPLYLMMVIFLIYFYTLKQSYEINPSIILNNFNDFIFNIGNKTELIIEQNIKLFCNIDYIKIKISDSNIDVNNIEEIKEKTINEEELNKIYDKYRYLIPISEKSFIEKVLMDKKELVNNNLNKKEELINNILIKEKKIIDITNINNEGIICNNPLSKIYLFNDTGSNYNTNYIYNNLLKYNFNDKNNNQITYAYKTLIRYINEPSILMLVKDEDLSPSIKNLFEILKRILNNNIFNKDICDTLKYYNILKENIPSFNLLNHETILFIIYQIIIPYYYDLYKTEKFIDYLF